ncbi:hypothetical protein D3C71_887420 [compost metagenome]
MSMQRYNKYNPKRKIAPQRLDDAERDRLIGNVTYGGNPEHKKNPGDYGLTPPATARANKALCDEVGIFKRSEALVLLKVGIGRGLVSLSCENGWPKNIWSVTEHGRALEAQLENSQIGSYHGYPMPSNDPLAKVVYDTWNRHA